MKLTLLNLYRLLLIVILLHLPSTIWAKTNKNTLRTSAFRKLEEPSHSEKSHKTVFFSSRKNSRPFQIANAQLLNVKEEAKLKSALTNSEQILQHLAKQGNYVEFLTDVFGQAGTPKKEFSKSLTELQADLNGGLGIAIELRTSAELKGAAAAYAAIGHTGSERIYINADWVKSRDISSSQIERAIVEEFGHAIDQRLNAGKDSPGDEGERFAISTLGDLLSIEGRKALTIQQDNGTITIDGFILQVAFTIGGTITGSINEDGTSVSGTLTLGGSTATINTTLTATPTYGSASVTSAGVWTYTINNALSAVQALASGGTLTDQFTVQGLKSNASADGTQAITITINGVDDAPTLTATGVTSTFTEGTGAAVGTAVDLFSTVTANTIEPAQTITRLDLSVTNVGDVNSEQLFVDGQYITLANGSTTTTANSFIVAVSGLTAGAGTATVSITKTGNATTTQIQTLVDGLTYRNISEDPSTASSRVISITRIDDSGSNVAPNSNTSNPGLSSTISITAVNDAPTLTATGTTATFTEGTGAAIGTAIDLFSTVTASTIEAGQSITRLDLSVTNVGNANSEQLFVDGQYITLANGSTTTTTNSFIVAISGLTAGTGTATVSISKTGNATTAQIQTLVDGLTYRNISEDPTTASSRVISITRIDDSGSNVSPNSNTSNPGLSSTITVSAVNDAPTLTATGATATFTEGSGATVGTAVDLFSTITASTIEAGQSITQLDLSVSNVGNANSEQLLVDGQYITLANGSTTTTSTSFVVAISGLTSGTGTATVSITKSGNATTGQIQTLVDGLAYRNTSESPTTASSRVISITRIDDSGSNVAPNSNTSNPGVSSTISLVSVNDAPSGADNTLTILEDGSKTFSSADFGFTDTDGNSLLAVKITTIPSVGTLKLNNVDVTAGQTIAVASIPTLVYAPVANANGTSYSSFTFQVQDNGGTANGGVDLDQSANTITFNVTSLNDAPSGTDNTFTILEDGSKTFSSTDFGFSDADGNSLLAVKITTLPGLGLLKLNNVNVTAGQTILVADISTLVYTPVANANGNAYSSFTFQVQDNGGTTNGGVDLDQSPNTITLNVTSVNDAPSGTDNAISILEDGSKTFSSTDFGFTDADGNSLLAVKISTLPALGTLKLNNVDVTLGQIIPLGNISTLVYTPVANANGTPYTTFTFQVQDNGGTTNGGVDLDQSPNTITFNVTAINDAPSGTDKTITFNEDATYTFTSSDFGFSDTDGNSLLAVKISTLPAAGTLKLNANPVTAGDFISAANITNLTYQAVANANGTAYSSFTFQVQDNGGTSNGGIDLDQSPNTITFDVNSVNDAPAGTDKSITINEDASHTFASTDFGFTDADGNSLLAVKITSLPSTGTLKLNNVDVSTAQFIAVADISTLVYTPVANANGSPYSTFTFQVQDNGGTSNGGTDLDQSANTISLNVNSVNDAPAGTDKTVTINEDASFTFASSDFGFTDTDGNGLLAVKIATLPGTGSLKLNNVGVNADDIILETDIPNLVYQPVANASGSPYATLTFQVQDNGGTANGGVNLDPSANTITFNVNSVNDAPAGTDKTITFNEDASYTFSSTDFGFTDTDGNSLLAVKVTSLPSIGSLKLNNVNVSVGQVIPTADISTLVFTSVANANGTPYTTFTFQVQDNGGTSNGGVDLDPSANTITFDVNSINDAPSGADQTVTFDENETYIFNTSDFGFTDTDANSLAAVKLTTLPAKGTIKLSNVAVTTEQFISVSDITSGNLTYDTELHGNGTAYSSFTFQVQDNGGTSNGGVDLDPTANTITFDVLSINNAPAGTDNTITLLEDGSHIFSVSDFGFTDPFDSPANGFLQVELMSLPSSGTLKLNGTVLTSSTIVTKAELDASKLVFTPVANANGTSYTTFEFQVQDDGGTANGGVNLDPTANIITLNVTAVNDAPTALNFTNTTTTLPENTSTSSRIKVADIAITDDEEGTETLTLSGTDAASFEIDGLALYIKAGVTLDYETKTSYNVRVNADDPTIGATNSIEVFNDFVFTVTDVDDTPPTVTSVQTIINDTDSNDIVPSVANLGDTFDFIITFSEAVTGLSTSDFSPTEVGSGTVILVDQVGLTTNQYRVRVDPRGNYTGNVTLSLKAGVLSDLAGNANAATGIIGTQAVDTQRPYTLTLVPANDINTTVANKVIFKVTFNESVTGIQTGTFDGTTTTSPDFSIFALSYDATITGVSYLSGNSYQVEVTTGATTSGAFVLRLLEGSVTDVNGNTNLRLDVVKYGDVNVNLNTPSVSAVTRGYIDIAGNVSLNTSRSVARKGDKVIFNLTFSESILSSSLTASSFDVMSIGLPVGFSGAPAVIEGNYVTTAGTFSNGILPGAETSPGSGLITTARVVVTLANDIDAGAKIWLKLLANGIKDGNNNFSINQDLQETIGSNAGQRIDTKGPTISINTPTDTKISATEKTTFVTSGTADGADGNTVTITFSDGITTLSSTAIVNTGVWTVTRSLSGLLDGTININSSVSDAAGNSATSNTLSVTLETVAPTVTDGNISITSTGTGTLGAYKRGDTLAIRWDNTASGDNNTDISTVTASIFGQTISLTNNAGIWTGSVLVNDIAATDIVSTTSITVTAVDLAGNSTTSNDGTSISIDNISPSITSSATINNDENNSLLYTASSTNPSEPSGAVYSLSGADAGLLTINASTGAVSLLTGVTDFESAKTTYEFTVIATDDVGNQSQLAVSVSVQNVNEAPTDISLSSNTVAEHQSIGTVVGSLTAVDPDASDIFTYSLMAGTGDSDNASFSVDNTGLITAGVFNYEVKNSYSIRVRVADAGGLTFEKVFTITVTNVNEAPTDISLSNSSISENLTSGSTVGTLSATDVDLGDTFTYSFASGTGDTDNSSFTILGSSLKSSEVFDYETKNSYSIRVNVTDAGGLTYEKTFTISVNNIDEVAPTFSSGTTASINENVAKNTLVYTAVASDSDYNAPATSSSVTYSLVSSTEFTINASTGEVQIKDIPDYETKNSYSFTVIATDAANNTSQKSVTLTINNLDEVAPLITSSTTANATENQNVLYTATATDDVDFTNKVITYTLKSAVGDENLVSINSSTGVVTLKTGNLNYESKTSYSFTVIVSDATGNSSEQSVTISVSNIDEVAPAITSSASGNATENQNVLYTTTATDAVDFTNQTITYSLKDNSTSDDAGLLNIGSSSGIVTLKTGNLNYESKTSYGFTVIASDATGNSTEKTVSILVLNIDEVAPLFTSSSSANALENQNELYTASATDLVDYTDQVISYSLKASVGDESLLTINSSTGLVDLKSGTLNYESKTSYTFTVIASDLTGNTSELPVTVNVTNIDEVAPAITSSASGNATENQNVLYTATATDAVDYTNQTITFSLKDNSTSDDAGLLNIGSSSGIVTLKTGNLNYESKTSYTFTVIASDATGNSSEKTVSITVTNIDEVAPAITSSASGNATENQNVLYTTTATDAVDFTNQTITYSLKDNSTSDDAGLLNIGSSSGIVTLKTGNLNYESKSSYTFTVIASDATGNSTEQTVTITVTNIDEVAPSITSFASGNATENQNVLYTSTATDAVDYTNQTITFSLKDNSTSDDAGLLNIGSSSGIVTLKTGNLNYESKTSYTFTVIASDATGNTSELAVTIAVNNLDEISPIFSSGTTASVNENVSGGTTVYTASATDPSTDGGPSTPLVYSIVGNDAASFDINSSSGLVSIKTSPNFETKSTYSFDVVVKDAANNSAQQSITLTINNIDEVAPSITSSASGNASENQNVLYTSTATDVVDYTNQTITYSLKDNSTSDDAGLLNIGSSSGIVTLKTGNLNFESKTSYTFTVIASDATGNTSELAVTITVNNLDEIAPVFSSGTTASVNENVSGGTTVYTASATDPSTDGGPSTPVTYTLSGTDAASFSISSGVVSINASPNYEVKTSYSFIVTATDAAGNSADQTVALSINNLDEVAPVFSSGTTASVNENVSGGTTVYTASATDPSTDGGPSTPVTYTLSGTDAASFSISSGVVSINASPNYEVKSSYSFDVTATDNAGNAATQTVTLSINNLDEVAPIFSSGTTASVNENVSGGTTVYTASATDPSTDGGPSTPVTYTLSGTDAASFSISSGVVSINASPNYEVKTSYSFIVTATDNVGNAATQTVTLSINNLDEVAPVFSSGTTASVNENVSGGTTVYTASATDPSTDGGPSTPVTYTLSGTDAASFSISAGVVSINASPNYEVKSSYSFDVTATDNVGNASTQTVTLSINNLDEVAPAFTSGTTASVNENVSGGTTVYTASATDPSTDGGPSTPITYTLSGTDAASFSISAGVVSINASPNYEVKSSYSFIVTARDNAGNTVAQTITLTINDLNEAPVLASTRSSKTVLEKATAAKLFTTGDVTITDVDSPNFNEGGISITGLNSEDVLSIGSVVNNTSGAIWRDGSYVMLGNGTTSDAIATISGGSGVTLRITFTSTSVTPSIAEDILEAITFYNNSANPTLSRTLSMKVSDAKVAVGFTGVESNAITYTVTITASNDAPIITLDAQKTVVENESASILTPTATVQDSDSPNLNTGVLTVSGLDADDVISISTTTSNTSGAIRRNSNNVELGNGSSWATIGTISGGSGATFTITFNSTSATPAVVENVLRSLTFYNNDDTPTLSRTLTVTLSDGQATSQSHTITVHITAVNDAPTVSLGISTKTVAENATASFLVQDGATAMTATVGDVDSPDFNSGGFTITGLNSEDEISFSATTNNTSGAIWRSGADLKLGTGAASSTIGTISGGVGNTMRVIFSSALVTPSVAQSILRAFTFYNNSDNPTTSRTLTLSLEDGDGDLSLTQTLTVAITPANDRPVVSSPATALTVSLSGASKSAPSGAVGQLLSVYLPSSKVSDPDGTSTSDLGIGITAIGGNSNLKNVFYSNDNGTTWTAVPATTDTNPFLLANSPTTRLYFQIQQSASNGDVTGMLIYHVWDKTLGTNLTTTSTVTTLSTSLSTDKISVTTSILASGTPPANTLPASYSGTEDTSLKLSGLQITDSDAGTNLQSIKLFVPSGTGTITATGNANVTIAGSGTNSITLTGTLTNLNSFLSTTASEPVYVPFANLNGTVAFTMETTDNTGLRASNSINISLTAVNDAPELDMNGSSNGLDGLVSFSEGGGAIRIAPLTLLTDIDSDNITAASITLTNKPNGSSEVLAVSGSYAGLTIAYNSSTGILSVSGTATKATYESLFRNITYNNTSANPDLALRTLKMTVTDASSSVSTERTVIVSLTNVNSAPVVANALLDQSITAGLPFSYTANAGSFTDPEGDALTYTATLADGSALPSWLKFNPSNLNFNGLSKDVGTWNVKVTATDPAGAFVSDVFVISATANSNIVSISFPKSYRLTDPVPNIYTDFYGLETSGLTTDTGPIVGTNFTFYQNTSAGLFNGNNIPGFFRYIDASGNVQEIAGYATRPIKTGSNIEGVYFVTDADGINNTTSGNTAYLLVINESYFTNGTSYNSSSDPIDSALNGYLFSPAFSITGGSVNEGGSITFTVSRSGSTDVATVNYLTTLAATDNASANDFTAVSGTLSFAKGVSQATVTVQTTSDAIYESNETFTVLLTNPSAGSRIDVESALGTINNDDAAPEFRIANAGTVEGGTIVFTVTRVGNAQSTQTVNYSTLINGTNTASINDFTTVNGTLSFALGETTKTISVVTTQDDVLEEDETFTLELNNPTGGAIVSTTLGSAIGTIENDEGVVIYSVNNVQQLEGGNLLFTISRTGNVQSTQSINWATSLVTGNTASLTDYQTNSGTVTFVIGDLTKTFTVASVADNIYEGNETFTVSLSSLTAIGSGEITRISTYQGTALGTIQNDDSSPVFSIANSSGIEGGTIPFVITRTTDAQQTQTVDYETTVESANTATFADFQSVSGSLTFAQGELTKSFNVTIVDDGIAETDETFSVVLSNATGGSSISGANGTATGTIVSVGIASQLSISTQPSSTAQSGLVFDQQPAIQLKDASGANVPQSGVIVTVALASGDNTLEGTLTATTDANGLATFTNLDISGVTGDRTLIFTSPNLTSVTSNTVTISAGAVSATTSTVTSAPSINVTADGTTTSTVTVTLKDANSNPVSGKTVVLTDDSTTSTISAASGSSNASGVVTFTVTNTI
ncbi:cadherin domain-containing protein, partial [Aquirufa sp. ROCK-SH2]